MTRSSRRASILDLATSNVAQIIATHTEQLGRPPSDREIEHLAAIHEELAFRLRRYVRERAEESQADGALPTPPAATAEPTPAAPALATMGETPQPSPAPRPPPVAAEPPPPARAAELPQAPAALEAPPPASPASPAPQEPDGAAWKAPDHLIRTLNTLRSSTNPRMRTLAARLETEAERSRPIDATEVRALGRTVAQSLRITLGGMLRPFRELFMDASVKPVPADQELPRRGRGRPPPPEAVPSVPMPLGNAAATSAKTQQANKAFLKGIINQETGLPAAVLPTKPPPRSFFQV